MHLCVWTLVCHWSLCLNLLNCVLRTSVSAMQTLVTERFQRVVRRLRGSGIRALTCSLARKTKLLHNVTDAFWKCQARSFLAKPVVDLSRVSCAFQESSSLDEQPTAGPLLSTTASRLMWVVRAAATNMLSEMLLTLSSHYAFMH